MPSKTPAKTIKRVPQKMVQTASGDIPDIDDDGDESPLPVNGPTDSNGLPKMKGSPASKIRRGFTEGQKQMDSTSSFAQTFKPDEKSQIIKFLERDPYASFRRHWIESRNDSGQTINRPYTCPLSFDEPCPLCEVGDRPQAVSSFNVALCGDDGQVLLRSWDVGARLFNVLKSYANDPKIGPLTKNFYLVSKTGKKNSVQYNVAPVRPASLEEDYDTPVPAESLFSTLILYTSEIIEVQPIKKLRELAAELTADDD